MIQSIRKQIASSSARQPAWIVHPSVHRSIKPINQSIVRHGRRRRRAAPEAQGQEEGAPAPVPLPAAGPSDGSAVRPRHGGDDAAPALQHGVARLQRLEHSLAHAGPCVRPWVWVVCRGTGPICISSSSCSNPPRSKQVTGYSYWTSLSDVWLLSLFRSGPGTWVLWTLRDRRRQGKRALRRQGKKQRQQQQHQQVKQEDGQQGSSSPVRTQLTRAAAFMVFKTWLSFLALLGKGSQFQAWSEPLPRGACVRACVRALLIVVAMVMA